MPLEPSETGGLPSSTYILSTVRHSQTGAPVVFFTLGGDDVLPVAAFLCAFDAAVA